MPRKTKSGFIVKTRRLGCCSSKQNRRRALSRMCCRESPATSSSGTESQQPQEEIPLTPRQLGLIDDVFYPEDDQSDPEDDLNEDQHSGSSDPESNGQPDVGNGFDGGESMESLNLTGLWDQLLERDRQEGQRNSQPGLKSTGPGETRAQIPSLYGLAIPKASFHRVCRDTLSHSPHLRFRADALEALQVACEDYLIALFQDSSKITAVRRAKTVSIVDIKLVLEIQNRKFGPPLPKHHGPRSQRSSVFPSSKRKGGGANSRRKITTQRRNSLGSSEGSVSPEVSKIHSLSESEVPDDEE